MSQIPKPAFEHVPACSALTDEQVLAALKAEFSGWRISQGRNGWYADAPAPMVSAKTVRDLREAILVELAARYH